MPKILLTLLTTLFIAGFAQAQFNKGSLLVGGELGFSSSSIDNGGNNQTNHSGNYGISLGKAINESSIFGINLNYAHYSNDNYYTPNGATIIYQGNNYTFGVFYRKYKTLGKDFYLFGEAGAGYTYSTETGANDAGVKQLNGNGNGGQLYFMPGIAYRVSKTFFLEITIPDIFLIQFNNSHTDYPNVSLPSTKNNEFAVTTSLNPNPLSALGIGFRLDL